jgi:hypothetical protein
MELCVIMKGQLLGTASLISVLLICASAFVFTSVQHSIVSQCGQREPYVRAVCTVSIGSLSTERRLQVCTVCSVYSMPQRTSVSLGSSSNSRRTVVRITPAVEALAVAIHALHATVLACHVGVF